METDEQRIKRIRTKIIKDLKSGEPYSYVLGQGELIIGVRSGYTDAHDEFQVYYCDRYNLTDEGICKVIKQQLTKSEDKNGSNK